MPAAKPLKNDGGVLTEMGATDVIPIANLATGTPTGTKFVRDDGTLAVPAGGPGGSATWTGLQVDTGSTSKRSGRFTITDATITALTPVAVLLAAGPYTGKGTLADEAQMYPGITFAAVSAAGSALVYWSAPYGSAVKGYLKINYQVSA